MRKRGAATLILAVTLLLGLVASACGGSNEGTAAPALAPTAAPAAAAPTTAPSTSDSSSGDATAQPTAAPSAPSTGSRPAAPVAMGPKPEYGGAYQGVITNPRIGQDPHKTTGSGYYGNWGHAMGRLLRFKFAPDVPTTEYILRPELVESWENPAPNVYILKLFEGIQWQDLPPVNAREFTSDDVVFSIQRLAGEGSAHRGLWLDLDKVEALDKLTVKVTLTGPSADFLSNAGNGFNVMVAKELVEAGDGSLFDGPTIGTGAWLLDCKVDVQCIGKRNPLFHVKDDAGNKLPYMDELQYIVIPDPQARFAAFRSKKLLSYRVTPEQNQIVNAKYPELDRMTYKAYGAWFNHYRQDQAPWNDVRVRVAASKAIDRQEIFDAVLGGRAHNALGMIMPSSDAYLPEAEFQAFYKQDIPGAKKLLAEAGYPDGIDAKFWIANYSEGTIAAAELMQQQLKEAGIRVELFIHDRPTYLSRVFIRHGEFEDMAYGPQGTFTADQWLLAYYHSDGGRNSSWTNDAKLDKLIEDQHTELDPRKRTAILLEIQRYLVEQQFQSVIHSPLADQVFWPWLKDLSVSAGGDYPGGRQVDYYWIDQAIYDKFH